MQRQPIQAHDKRVPLARLNLRGLILMLTAATALLIVAHAVVVAVEHILGHPRGYGLVTKFNLNAENNAPTWFSSFLMLVAAALCWLVANAKKGMSDSYTRHWTALWIIFLLASIER